MGTSFIIFFLFIANHIITGSLCAGLIGKTLTSDAVMVVAALL